jgi:hypothetical protein
MNRKMKENWWVVSNKAAGAEAFFRKTNLSGGKNRANSRGKPGD